LQSLSVRESELSGKDLFVQMNAATAKKAGLAEGAKVKLSAGKGELKARVHLNEGVAPGTTLIRVILKDGTTEICRDEVRVTVIGLARISHHSSAARVFEP
jgi:anaerobic selenocysteine-containing dehydrogenase